MATRTLNRVAPANDNLVRGAWRVMGATGLTNTSSDVTSTLGPDDYGGYNERSVQVVGTFGTGGTLTIQGSIDGSTWATLNDPQGNPLAIQAAKIEAIMEATPYLRAAVTAGDVNTNLDCYFFLRQDRL